jgi:hypothetical protein
MSSGERTLRGSIKYKKGRNKLVKKTNGKKTNAHKYRKSMVSVFYITNNPFRSLISLFSMIFIGFCRYKSVFDAHAQHNNSPTCSVYVCVCVCVCV